MTDPHLVAEVPSRRQVLRGAALLSTGLGSAATAEQAALSRAAVPAAAEPADPYDVSEDIRTYRAATAREDYAGDNVPLQQAADRHRSLFIPAERVGGLDLRQTVYFRQRGARLVVGGSAQSVPLVRHPSHIGDTFVFGDESSHPAGDVYLENLWFVHPGRLGYGDHGMVDAAGRPVYPEGSPLPNRLTGGQAHLRIHGAQSATLRHVGGWGMPHVISLHGCAGVVIDQPFTFGSVYDEDNPAAQEGLSHIRCASGSKWGANSSISIRQPQLYGQNRTRSRAVTIDEKTVHVSRRIGPRSIYLINSCEDWEIIGGFAGQASSETLLIEPDSEAAVIFNGLVISNLDESNRACIRVRRNAPDHRIPDGLTVIGSFLNGQVITERGIVVEQGPGGIASLRGLHVSGGTALRAFLGAGAYLAGVESGMWEASTVRGYNCVGSSQPAQGGIVIDGMTSHFDVTNVRFGGGINGTDERNAAASNGITPNGTRCGLVRLSGANGVNLTRGRLLRLPFGAEDARLVIGDFGSAAE